MVVSCVQVICTFQFSRVKQWLFFVVLLSSLDAFYRFFKCLVIQYVFLYHSSEIRSCLLTDVLYRWNHKMTCRHHHPYRQVWSLSELRRLVTCHHHHPYRQVWSLSELRKQRNWRSQREPWLLVLVMAREETRLTLKTSDEFFHHYCVKLLYLSTLSFSSSLCVASVVTDFFVYWVHEEI
jgi:hypothetical protein